MKKLEKSEMKVKFASQAYGKANLKDFAKLKGLTLDRDWNSLRNYELFNESVSHNR